MIKILIYSGIDQSITIKTQSINCCWQVLNWNHSKILSFWYQKRLRWKNLSSQIQWVHSWTATINGIISMNTWPFLPLIWKKIIDSVRERDGIKRNPLKVPVRGKTCHHLSLHCPKLSLSVRCWTMTQVSSYKELVTATTTGVIVLSSSYNFQSPWIICM